MFRAQCGNGTKQKSKRLGACNGLRTRSDDMSCFGSDSTKAKRNKFTQEWQVF